MAEKLTLTSTLVEQVRDALQASSTELLPFAIHLGLGVDTVNRVYQDAGSYIEAKCLGMNGTVVVIQLATPGAAARILINQLNKVNLSTTSLLKRVLQQLQTVDAAKYAGAISGTPD